MAAKFSRKASNSAPPGPATPCPDSDMKGDYRGVTPTERFKSERDTEYNGLAKSLKGINPQQANEGKAKDPTPNNE